jgi:Ca2+-transporting ATPase
VIIILLAASAISFAFGRWVEGIAIFVAVVINGAIGFFTEFKAVRMMESLRELSKVSTKVLRKNSIEEIPAEQIVPGDIVVVEAGDIVTADIRLVEASRLQVEESSLTGESVPVAKNEEQADKDKPLAERKNMLFKGTTITQGSCKGIVVATGMNTELGHISSLVEEAEEEITPLEKRLNRLGHRLLWMTLGIAVIVAIAGIVAGRELLLMVETSIALAVAAIPEGLPIVATIALAKGMWRMARRNALINCLSSVETLGATNIIFTLPPQSHGRKSVDEVGS